jgi:TolB-like protein
MMVGPSAQRRAKWFGAIVAIGALAVVTIVLARRSPSDGGAGPNDSHLGVIPFRAASSNLEPLGATLAESLASRLTRLPGLTATVQREWLGRSSEFTVRGEVAARDGRFVVTAQLEGGSGNTSLWTGTLWRKDSLDSALVSDLAASLAEAIYGHLARTDTARASRTKPAKEKR